MSVLRLPEGRERATLTRFGMGTSSNQAKRWFYVREGRRQGPVDTDRLVDLVLHGEVAEDALVWHSGLPEWLRAQEVEEIRRELPPPVPTPSPVQAPAPTPEPMPSEAASRPGASAQDEAPVWERTGPLPDLASAAEPEDRTDDPKRRRRRKHRHRESKRRPPWLWPLVAILAGLMVFLWWLLRRMNEVPPGRIIQTSSLYAGGAPKPPAPGEARRSSAGLSRRE